jgi:hypothetical protein
VLEASIHLSPSPHNAPIELRLDIIGRRSEWSNVNCWDAMDPNESGQVARGANASEGRGLSSKLSHDPGAMASI